MVDAVVPTHHAPAAEPRPRGRTVLRIALTVLGVLTVAAIAVLRQMLSQLLPFAWMVDFSVYYEGGRTALHGGSLYDLGVDTTLFADMPFTYSPFAAALFAPLSLLGKGFAIVAWTVLNTGCLVGLVWLSLSMMNVQPIRRRLTLTLGWTVAVLVLDPVLLNLLVGQINIVIALLVLIDLSPYLPARWRGIMLGVAAGIKLIPLIFVVYLFVTGRRGTAVRAGLTFLGTVAVGFLALPRDSVRYWVDGVFLKSGRTLHSIVVNHSLSGLFARIAGTDVAPGWAWPLVVVVGVLGLALAVWVHRQGQEMLGILVVAFTSLLVSPITWPMHAIWIVPALVWLAFAKWRSRTVLPKVVFVLVVLSYLLPVYEMAQRTDRYQNTLPGNLIATFGGLLFKTALILVSVPLWLRRLRQPEPGPTSM